MGLKIITQPTEEPFTIEQCRQHLRIQPYEFDSDGQGVHPDDAEIMRMQSQARDFCEDFLGASLVQRTYELALDQFPADEIELPMPPAVEIISVKYADSAQVEHTIPVGQYTLDDYQMPAWLLPAANNSWPSAGQFVNSVKVRYIAGYGKDSISEPIPHAIGAALLLMLGHMYENREAVNIGNITSEIPLGVDALLRPHRVRKGMA